MEHQDWKPIILRKNVPQKSLPQYQEGFKTKQNLDSAEPEAPKRFGAENGKLLQSARLAKKWTQKELGQKLNIAHTVVRDYEQGDIVPEKTIVNKMTKLLGVKFSG